MRKCVLVVALFAIAFTSAASARSRMQSAQDFVDRCVAIPEMSSSITPESACACLLGHFSARMNDRQLEMLGAVAGYASDDVRGSAIEQLVQDGYTKQEFDDVARIVDDLGDLPTRTCSIFEQ